MGNEASLIPIERIDRAILVFRGHRIMLDEDLAGLYGVEIKALNQAVKRNLGRFPGDFMFQLTKKETEILRSQSVTSSSWGGRRTCPYAFTEQGVATCKERKSVETGTIKDYLIVQNERGCRASWFIRQFSCLGGD